MARVYKFQNTDKTIDVDILVDAIDNVQHFLIVDVHDLQKKEVQLGFDLSRDGYYYEKEFIEYAESKQYNLYRWDNQTSAGQLYEVDGYSDYYQWLFTGKSGEIVDNEYIDYGTGGNNATIGNTQVATFDGIGYISGDFTGWTISSYKGLATPTKTSDSRIDVTADQIYSITITDGTNELTWYAIEGLLGEIHFTGNGIVLITQLESLVLEDVWANKSNLAYPALLANGGNQYLICESDGTALHSADPEESNLGDEKVVNGGFDDDSNWVTSGLSKIINGSAHIYSTNSDITQIYQNDVFEVGKIYYLTIDVLDVLTNTVRVQVGGDILYTISSIDAYTTLPITFKATGAALVFKRSASEVDTYVDNVSAKEILAIPLLGTQKYKILPTISDMYYLDSNDITIGSGYMVRTTSTYISLYRVDLGVLTQLDTDTLTIADYSEITNTFSETGITVAVEGVQALSSNDLTYTEFKLLVTDNDAGAEILHASKDGVKYINSFCCGTGEYGIQNVIGV